MTECAEKAVARIERDERNFGERAKRVLREVLRVGRKICRILRRKERQKKN